MQQHTPENDTSNKIRQTKDSQDQKKSESPMNKPDKAEGDISKVYERPTTAHDAEMNQTKDS